MKNEKLFPSPVSLTPYIFASGSDGNCCALYDGKSIIQLECGLSVAKTLKRLRNRLPDAILVTHEHSDHARYAESFLKRGIDMYMTHGTAEELDIARHNLHVVKPGEPFEVCGHRVLAIPVKHDAAQPVCFVIDGTTLFLTDAGIVPDELEEFKFRQVLIEANYEDIRLNLSDINEFQKERIERNHLSILQTKIFLRNHPEIAEVYLLHVSKRHGSAREFQRSVIRATGIENVFISEVTI